MLCAVCSVPDTDKHINKKIKLIPTRKSRSKHQSGAEVAACIFDLLYFVVVVVAARRQTTRIEIREQKSKPPEGTAAAATAERE